MNGKKPDTNGILSNQAHWNGHYTNYPKVEDRMSILEHETYQVTSVKEDIDNTVQSPKSRDNAGLIWAVILIVICINILGLILVMW